MKRRHKRSRLEFREIADEWAAEDGEPAHEPLKDLIASVWFGNFEDAAGRSRLFLNTADKAVRFSRRGLLTALKAFSKRTLNFVQIPAGASIRDTHDSAVLYKRRGEAPPENVKSWDDLMAPPWESVKDRVPWRQLAALRLDQYEDFFRETYLERLCISKGDFRAWCSKHEIDLPEFWFVGRGDAEEGASAFRKSDEEQVEADPNRTGGLTANARSKGGSRSKQNPWLLKAIRRIVDMLNEDGIPPTSTAIWNWLCDNAQLDNPYEFDPPIPGCDDLYVDGDTLYFKDQEGNVRIRNRRTLERYLAEPEANPH